MKEGQYSLKLEFFNLTKLKSCQQSDVFYRQTKVAQ